MTRSVFDYLTNADLISIVGDSMGIPDINRICDNRVSKLEEKLNIFVYPVALFSTLELTVR